MSYMSAICVNPGPFVSSFFYGLDAISGKSSIEQMTVRDTLVGAFLGGNELESG